jgi:hypothetical protein
MDDVATLIADVERRPDLPAGGGERFGGYGVMGLPFASGHALAMRRFPASSIGPAYTSVWHRDPHGQWTFWQTQPPDLACTRYFSASVDAAHQVAIEVGWPEPDTLQLTVPEADMQWTARMRSTPVTRVLNMVGSVLPDRWWRSPAVLGAMSSIAGPALRAGRLRLAGAVPNGQRFIANPLRVWTIDRATAVMSGEDFGPLGALGEQAILGDFRIPQRGVFVIGRAFFAS